MTTVDQARGQLLDALLSGRTTTCPCCSRRVSRYRRRIHGEMGRFLCLLVRSFLDGTEWTHIEKIQPKNGNYAMLRLWDLATPSSKRNAGRNAHGLWRPTMSGVLFAQGHTHVEKYLFLWNGQVVGRSEDVVTIREVLGTKFNYQELMGG